jgi:hypothetical protein
MGIIEDIQSDLIDHNAPLSDILRKAKVLASQLDNKELASWASMELDGYPNISELPDYRFIATSATGLWTNGYYQIQNQSVPLFKIDDEDLRKILTTVQVDKGIKSIEQLAKMKEDDKLIVHPTAIAYLNTKVGENGYGFLNLFYTVGPHDFEQILDTVRNRLLDFVLLINKNWNITKDTPKQEDLNKLFNITIYNNPQGDSMSVFDQRGQKVEYQYNAAGNINIEKVNSPTTYAAELDKFQDEISESERTGIINKETAIEIKYYLLSASKEAKAEKPNKEILSTNLEKVMDILKNISTLVGLATSVAKLIEIIPILFPK